MDESIKRQRILKAFLSILSVLVAAMLVSYIIQQYVLILVVVPTPSMKNTININDRLLGLKTSGLFKYTRIKRGDIVAFKMPDNKEEIYIKRVIGLPGDTIYIRNSILFVNNKPYKEDYILEKMEGNYGPYKVPENHYFMLGDNRNDSFDSREWVNPYVEKKDIVGKVIFRVYPLKKIGFIN
ncbi:signal peptidase I [Caldicellulosiruptoraceae bacterium PP1]